MKNILITLICVLAFSGMSFAQAKYTISGKVKDQTSGEDLLFTVVQIRETGVSVQTNDYGFYSITLPEGTYTVVVTTYGFLKQEKTVTLNQNVTLDFELEPEGDVVVIDYEATENVESTQMSTVELDINQVKKLPRVFGEPDLLKIVQMQPGVVSAGEGTSAFFVRGGSADQNLIMIDEAPVYDPSHLFGLFSVFNADIIKSTELYKGGIPSRYGGRLASLLDVRTLDGNVKKFGGTGSVGLMATKLMLQGPIKKDKASFMVSGRQSYVGYFLRLSPDEDNRNNNVYFFDYSLKLNWNINKNNRVFVSSYFGRDVFKFGDFFNMNWGNLTTTVRWNHLFNDKLFLNTTFIFSNFDYAFNITDPVQGFRWTADIKEFTLKQDYSWFANNNNTITYGFSTAYRTFSPGSFKPNSSTSIFANTVLPALYAWDNAVYVRNEQRITSKLKLDYGIRLTYFANLGPSDIYTYQDKLDYANPVRTSTKSYSRGQIVQDFFNPELRFSARYKVGKTSSIKMSYNRMVQYIHQMVTGTVPLPIAFWLPSSPYLRPAKADQVVLGYFRNLKDNTYEVSVESYYKYMKDIVDYAPNSNVFFNQDIATTLRQGFSWSYGLEFMIKKDKGKLNGWLSYTWSKTQRQVATINYGDPYYANYDRRHSINLVGTYDLSERISFGGSWVYGSGKPITLASGTYQYQHWNPDFYTERNGYRLQDYHRLDISMTLRSKIKEGRKWKGEWNFAIYNLYSRKNVFTIFTQSETDDNNNIQYGETSKVAYKIYLFPILPSVSYSITF